MTYLPKRVFPVLTILFTVSVVGELGREWWIFDLFSHWRMLYLISGLALVLIGLLSGLYKYVAVIFAVVCLHVFRLWPYLVPHPQTPVTWLRNLNTPVVEPQYIKVAFINTYWKIKDMDGVAAAVREMNPDFVFLEEIQPDQFAILERKLPEYMNNYHEAVPMAFDMGYLSKLPVSTTGVIYFLKGVPTIEATVQLKNGPIKIIGVHPPSPVSEKDTLERNELLEKVFLTAQLETSPIIIGGDFNISQFSPVFRDLLKKTTLIDTIYLSGIENSWSSNLPTAIRIPIDQIFISPGFTFEKRIVGPATGSDHLPVMVEVAL